MVGADDAKVAENNFDLTGEYGRSDLDIRHRFIFSPVYETGTFKYSDNKFVRAVLSDYVITGIVQAQSGFAYSALVSGDPNNDGNTSTDRVPEQRETNSRRRLCLSSICGWAELFGSAKGERSRFLLRDSISSTIRISRPFSIRNTQ